MTYVRILLNFQIFKKNVQKIEKMNIGKYVNYNLLKTKML
jgi:hypothetical protein